MSSAILYVAIVAIWAVVLVPRWLRPRVAPPQPVPVPAGSPDAVEPADPGQDAGVPLAVSADGPDAAGEPVGGDAMAGSGISGSGISGSGISGSDASRSDASRSDASGSDVYGEDAPGGEAPEAEIAAPSPALRRPDVLKARRRLLSTLITLTVIAVGLVVTGIDAYWIVVPPTVLLTGYVVLLRQFAHIDAERDRRAAGIRHARAAGSQAATAREPVPASAAGDSGLGPDAAARLAGAEIIDISGRIGDQVYDQYSDAANRAVGD